MEELDFQNAGIVHLVWKKKIRALLDGRAAITEVKHVSHKECELGRWLYSSGLKQYGQLKEMRQLEGLHIEIHNICNRILGMIKEERKGAAEVEYKKLDTKSKDMIKILTLLSVQGETENNDKEKNEIE